MKLSSSMEVILHFILPAVYSALFFFTFGANLSFVQFIVGTYLGFGLLFIDRLLHVFFLRPEEAFHQSIRQIWREHGVVAGVRSLWSARTAQEKLLTRSVLFLLGYVAVTIYVLTSTGSVLAMGTMLGLGLHYCFDFLRYRQQHDVFQRHFLWQVNKQFAQIELDAFIAAFCVFFLLVSLLVLA